MLAALLVVGLAVVSVRGLIDPQQASLRFGFQWTPPAVLLTAAAALPIFDMTVLSFDGVTPPAFHKLALARLAMTAALFWRLSHLSRS